MKIGISLNDVVRATTQQTLHIYKKYIDKECDIQYENITDFDLTKFLKFKSIDDLNNFLFFEAPLEIFGHAGIVSDNLISTLNNFILDIADENEHEIVFISREFEKSVPATYFFISKTGLKARNVRLITKLEDEWKDIDLLITANNMSLSSKPTDKISIKIETPYNKDQASDYTFNKLEDVIQSTDFINQIMNQKIIQIV